MSEEVENERRRRAGTLSRFIGSGVVAVLLMLGGATLLAAHDLFLKPGRFFVAPNDSVHIDVLNGTFTSSEAAVAPERLRELSLAGPDGVVHPATDSWAPAEKASRWHVVVGRSGTYVLGAAVLPRALRLEA